MSSNECGAIIDSYNQSFRNSWEQTRYVAFITAAVISKKIKKPADLLKFVWDNEVNDDDVIVSKEERMKMEEEMINRYYKLVKKEQI